MEICCIIKKKVLEGVNLFESKLEYLLEFDFNIYMKSNSHDYSFLSNKELS